MIKVAVQISVKNDNTGKVEKIEAATWIKTSEICSIVSIPSSDLYLVMIGGREMTLRLSEEQLNEIKG